MGVEVAVEKLTKSFGKQMIWEDVTLTLPPGEISVLLGPSGTGKSVFLKSLVGLLKPDRGSIFIKDIDLAHCREHELYETRKLFGVLFQDGALFGSMNLFDNIAFPLREHTKKGEKEVRDIVMEKLEMVGLSGTEGKLPGEISGGMRKRAGLARALVLDPEIILFDEPDSGLDPVRVAYLNQLIVDLNAQTDATFLIVTHDIGTARTVPDNLGLLFRRNLVMFGPREVLLTSEEAVVKQFLNGRREGPIGMSEEKDASQVAAELAALEDDGPPPPGTGPKGASGSGVPPQLEPSPGLPPRAAAERRKARVMELLHTLPEKAQEVIRASLEADGEIVRGAANGYAPDRAPANWLKDDGHQAGHAAPAQPQQQRRPSPWPQQPDHGAAAPAATDWSKAPSDWPQNHDGQNQGGQNQDGPGSTDRGQGLGQVQDYDRQPAHSAEQNGAEQNGSDQGGADQTQALAYPDGTLVLPPADEELGTYGTDGGPVGPAAEGSGQAPETDGHGAPRR